MTDTEARAYITTALHQFIYAQIAEGHPAGLVFEVLAAESAGYAREAKQTTKERIQSALQEAKNE